MHATIKLSDPATRQFWEIPVLFEDAHLLAVDKPVGLMISPDQSAPERPSLMQLLHRGIARGAPWAAERQLSYLANTHRLDPEISGVLLLAKTKPVLVAIADQFGIEKPSKSFVALISGSPAGDFQVDAKIGREPLQSGVPRLDARDGRKARTRFQILERFTGYTLLRCQPLTGQPHQIRVHLKSRGMPVLGDSLYGGPPLLLSVLKPDYRLKPNRTERPLISTPALHLEELNLSHPATGAPLAIRAPWPKDLTVAVKYLRRYASGIIEIPVLDGRPD